MDRKKYKTIFILLSIAPLLTVFNILILKYLVSAEVYQSFHYPLPLLYLLFTAASALILWIQIKIKKNNPDQIGYVFLLTTSVKMGLCYALLYPILNQVSESYYFEKINFFIIFVLFLAIEVVLTSRLLKDEDKKD